MCSCAFRYDKVSDMPASGPVYQPTTVSYEQQNEWSQQDSYMSESGNPPSLRNPRCLQWLILALGVSTFAVGLLMCIQGIVTLSSDNSDLEFNAVPKTGPRISPLSGLVFAIVGAVLMVVGILLVSVYVRLVRNCTGCPCFPSKEQRLARQLDHQATNGQILTLNPSTDLLVTAQYGPVSEIAYQPPAVSEQEEMSKLMANDNKECNEESERMLESDPRIVLRPLSHNEEA